MDIQSLRSSEHEWKARVGRSVSLDHAAQILRVSRRTIYYHIRDGRLRTMRTPGGSQRVLLTSIEEIVSASRERSCF